MEKRFRTYIIAKKYGTYSLALGIVVIFAILFGLLLQNIILLCILLAITSTSLIYCLDIYSRYTKGFKGEFAVAQELKKLKKYHIFHDVKLPNNNGNIDHIVLGKNGLFAIETKNPKKTLIKSEGDLWTGYNQKELRSPSLQLKRNIVLLKEFLGKRGQHFWVHGAVVFTNPEVELHIKDPKVPILRLKDVTKWIKNQNSYNLNQKEINDIKEKLVNNSKFIKG